MRERDKNTSNEKKSRITFIGGEGVHRESAKQPNIGADAGHSFREMIVEDNSGGCHLFILFINSRDE